MTPAQLARLSSRLESFLTYCFEGLGRLERRQALSNYLRGLLLDGERKSVEPIALRLIEDQRAFQGMRQSLLQAISVANWDEGEVFRRVAVRVEQQLPEIGAFVIDDTGLPKKGYASVGVSRQYSGTMGRIDNCQVVTSLHLASEHGGAVIGMRLYLPQSWADDRRRRAKAHVPEHVEFSEKWRLAVAMLDDALSWGVAKHVVVADAAYGDTIDFRKAIVERGLDYVVGTTGTAVVWPPGVMPTPPQPRPGVKGRPRNKWTDGDAKAMSISELARSLPGTAWRKVTWREGSRGRQSSRFAAVRIRTAHRHVAGDPPGDEQWLLCEWPERAVEPTTFYLSSLPASTPRKRLVYLAKLRWRIERDYQELKSELGLDHFEGRSWGGIHHHLACVAAAHAFLTLERVRFPPEDPATDIPRLPPTASGGAPADDRDLSALHPTDRSRCARHAFADVIE
jgi:SRSO17 transposase